MAETGLPPEVVDLVARHLPSMQHVETLLLLRRADPEAVAADAVVAEIHGGRALTLACLEDLADAGLIARSGGRPSEGGPAAAYRFAPATPALRAAADKLAEMYSVRPVTLVRAVYDRPPAPPAADPIRSFANAFRLRADGKG
ncbi:MAG TPA: hypothetical protein VKA84_25100 [Gemmatimonadaceae bacterium]|nr:hypothetical protein [Gemmatimonadaceae bacterium]